MTETRRCIVIPAIKKNAVIPDQLVKRLAGVTLIQRAIDTARGVVPAHDVVVVTDSQEISLICERNGVRVHYNAGLRFTSLDIITEMKSILRELGNDYGHIIIYRASCPLLTWVDIDDAYKTFLENEADCLVTVKSVRHRIWEVHQGRLESFNQSWWSRARPSSSSKATRWTAVPSDIPYRISSMIGRWRSTAIRTGGCANAF